jgi:hypothetical protein
MNKNLFEIAYILDRSGSMQCMVEPAIAGFNQVLREQREAPGEARLSLILFDDQYELPCDRLPLEEVPDLDTTTYVPRAMTALLDAIGRTINEIDQRLDSMLEAERPGKVMVAIFTDGLENASREFSLDRINHLIREKRENHGWEFLFLAANQDAIATARGMGINPKMSGTVQFSKAGVHASSSGMSRKMKALREFSVSARKSEDFDAPMQDIAEEEEKKKSDEDS